MDKIFFFSSSYCRENGYFVTGAFEGETKSTIITKSAKKKNTTNTLFCEVTASKFSVSEV